MTSNERKLLLFLARTLLYTQAGKLTPTDSNELRELYQKLEEEERKPPHERGPWQ